MAFSKQTLPEAVSERLQAAIHAHQWRETLPGIRVLCDEVKVSRQTMMLALRLLEKAGYLHPAKPGRPRLINQAMVGPVKPASKNKSSPTITVITGEARTDLSQTDAQICNYLRESIKSRGFVHRHLVFPYISRAMGGGRIANVIEQNPADVYVVMSAHPRCSAALKKLAVPAVYIGGVEVKGCQPRVSYSLTEMCDSAVAHLASIGHQKITVMQPEGINSSSKKESEGERAVGRIFKNHGLPFSTYNSPRWGKTRADFNQALEQLFSITPPTALILGDINQVPRVVSFLMRHGLKYPDDVSLIVLDESRQLQEYEPPVSFLKLNNASLAKLVVSSVRKKLHSLPDEKLILAKTKLVITGSIAKPKQEQ